MNLRSAAAGGILMASFIACGRDEPRDRLIGDTATTLPPVEAQLSDGNVVAMLVNTNQAEMNIARAAQTRSSAREVREYAERMLTEHAAMQRSLDSLASARGIVAQAPLGEDRVHAALAASVDSLLPLTGTPFDTAYMRTQIAAHRQALDDVRAFSLSAGDTELRAFLSRSTPTIQAHLDRAIDLQRELSR